MITKPTVFVLGAGASIPYGFPSGKQLVEHICEATRRKNSSIPLIPDDSRYLYSRENINATLIDQFGKNEVENFGNALYLSHQYSIDAFLANRPEYMEIGKVSIALFILRKEMEADLSSFENRNKGCYQFIFNKLTTQKDELKENRVSFITFNYDRSLEYFLFTSLKNTYGLSDEECAEQINFIPIIHVHGLLGQTRWHSKGIPYGTLNEYSIKNRVAFDLPSAISAAKQIKIITEEQADSEEFRKARKLIEQTERLYFLGFGYNSTNMERLGLESLRVNSLGYENSKLMYSPLMGTGLGMEDAEVYSVQEKWKVAIPDNKCDSLLFLRKYADLG